MVKKVPSPPLPPLPVAPPMTPAVVTKNPPPPPPPPPPVAPPMPQAEPTKTGGAPPAPPPRPGGPSAPRPPMVPVRAVSKGQVDQGSAEQAKLKPLHWDKVNANADHSMVWDNIGRGSFQLSSNIIILFFSSSKLQNLFDKFIWQISSCYNVNVHNLEEALGEVHLCEQFISVTFINNTAHLILGLPNAKFLEGKQWHYTNKILFLHIV